MTISLAIDTSTSRTSVAIVEGNALLWHGFRDGATSHGSALPALVSEGLAVQQRIDQVVVGMGPGPYTGLRVGIAFAHTFALARRIPVVGVCSIDAIASLVHEDFEFIVATDARRKEIYWAKYSMGTRVDGPHVDRPEVVAQLDLPIYGEGAVKYSIASADDPLYPDSLSLVTLSQSTDSQISEPLYLRRPDAVPTKERLA
ncbi:MAG: tRNA (adenosine(37)-N6)-threonylcarbamoyltransferase complex dimerization subunit type 1 TsaB [Actinomycetota bacterium]